VKSASHVLVKDMLCMLNAPYMTQGLQKNHHASLKILPQLGRIHNRNDMYHTHYDLQYILVPNSMIKKISLRSSPIY
jgi:hypothetical protein